MRRPAGTDKEGRAHTHQEAHFDEGRGGAEEAKIPRQLRCRAGAGRPRRSPAGGMIVAAAVSRRTPRCTRGMRRGGSRAGVAPTVPLLADVSGADAIGVGWLVGGADACGPTPCAGTPPATQAARTTLWMPAGGVALPLFPGPRPKNWPAGSALLTPLDLRHRRPWSRSSLNGRRTC